MIESMCRCMICETWSCGVLDTDNDDRYPKELMMIIEEICNE